MQAQVWILCVALSFCCVLLSASSEGRSLHNSPKEFDTKREAKLGLMVNENIISFNEHSTQNVEIFRILLYFTWRHAFILKVYEHVFPEIFIVFYLPTVTRFGFT